jgi:hypothetical protein
VGFGGAVGVGGWHGGGGFVGLVGVGIRSCARCAWRLCSGGYRGLWRWLVEFFCGAAVVGAAGLVGGGQAAGGDRLAVLHEVGRVDVRDPRGLRGDQASGRDGDHVGLAYHFQATGKDGILHHPENQTQNRTDYDDLTDIPYPSARARASQWLPFSSLSVRVLPRSASPLSWHGPYTRIPCTTLRARIDYFTQA